MFEMPVLLSQSPQDYTVLAVAYILPPALSFAAKYVISKLRKRARALKVTTHWERASEPSASLGRASQRRGCDLLCACTLMQRKTSPVDVLFLSDKQQRIDCISDVRARAKGCLVVDRRLRGGSGWSANCRQRLKRRGGGTTGWSQLRSET